MPSRPRRKTHTRSKTSDEESNIGLIHSSRPNGLSRATTSATNDIPMIKDPKISKKKILGWRSSIIAPWFVSACLLYLLTNSNPIWRNDWSVVKVHLPGGEWGSIESRGRGISGNVLKLPTKRQDDGEKGEERQGENDEEGEEKDGGWLSVNMWGWCLQDVSKNEIICSGEDMLFDLDELLGEESRSSAPSGEDFNFILTHGLIIHGMAMVTAMTAVIPMIITTFRIIRAKQPTVQGGWFEHGLLLAACILCLIAYIIDRLLKNSVEDNLEKHKVLSGQALTINGICTLFLFLTFLLSALPPCYFHMKRQSQLVRYWEDLEDFDEASADDHEEKPVQKKRPKKVKRSRTIRAARALFGRRDGEERRVRREGTISRWTSRRRRRRDDRAGNERRERYDTRHRRRRRRHRDSW